MLLVIRKVQNAPEEPGAQPQVETSRSYLMSDRSLHLEVSLDKEVVFRYFCHLLHTYTHRNTFTYLCVKKTKLLFLSSVALPSR